MSTLAGDTLSRAIAHVIGLGKKIATASRVGYTSLAGIQHPISTLQALWAATIFLSMCALALFCLWQTTNSLVGMYGNIDGQWAAWNLQGIFTWSTPFDLSPFNPVAGMGSMYLPNLPWLNPGAWPFAFGLPADLAYGMSYAIYFAELFLSSYALFRSMDASKLHSFLASQLIFLFFFPPFSAAFNTLSWYSLAPVNAHLASMCNLAMLAALRIGTGGWRYNLKWSAVLLAAVVAGFYSGPITILTYAPVYAFFLILLTLDKKDGFEALRVKLGVAIGVAALLYLSGVFDYILSTSAVSARSSATMPFMHPGSALLTFAYWSDLVGSFNTCTQNQVLLCTNGKFSAILLLAIFGAAFAAILSDRLRATSIGFVAFVAATHLYAVATTGALLGILNKINVAFFVWAAIPFIAYFVAFPVVNMAARIKQKRAGIQFCVITLVVPLLMTFVWYGQIARTQPPPAAHKQSMGILPPAATRSPLSNEIVETLSVQAAILPASEFRGLTAVYFGGPNGWLTDELNLPADFRGGIASRHYLNRVFGNMFQEMDLWNRNIPTFGEYGQWVTKPAFQLTTALLSEPDHRVHPSFLRVSKINIPILQMLGVRFILTDSLLTSDKLSLLAEISSDNADAVIRLYEADTPNLGTYSPTEIETVDTFEQALVQLEDNKLQLKDVGVAFQEPLAPLVAADSTTMTLVRDGWRLQASSKGRSIVAVPWQFTNCWTIKHPSPSTRLYRGNAIQTYVEFEGIIDIEVHMNFGVFSNARCRKQDAQDLDALGL